MTDRLVFVESYVSSRPTRCRHCGQSVNSGGSVVLDPSSPWLAIHADCLRALLPERVEQLYLDMAATTPIPRSVSSKFRERIDQLRRELDDLERFASSKTDRLFPLFRPGRLRSTDPKAE